MKAFRPRGLRRGDATSGEARPRGCWMRVDSDRPRLPAASSPVVVLGLPAPVTARKQRPTRVTGCGGLGWFREA